MLFFRRAFTRLSPPGTHFTAESTDAMRIKSLAQGENILMLRIEPSTFVSKIDIVTTTPIVHNNSSNISNISNISIAIIVTVKSYWQKYRPKSGQLQ